MPITQLPGGSLRDEVRQPIYDSIDLTAGPVAEGVRKFFSNVQNKGVSLTNLRQNNMLETAVSFRIMGLAIDVQNFRDANVVIVPLITENSGIQLILGEKQYWQGPMRFACGRLWTDLAASAEAAIMQQYGFAAVAPVILVGQHVVDLNPLQTFSVLWTLEGLTAAEQVEADLAADTKLRFVCSLKGLMRRPVQ